MGEGDTEFTTREGIKILFLTKEGESKQALRSEWVHVKTL